MILLVDVGNSRIKWGLVESDRIIATAALPLPTDPEQAARAWQGQIQAWGVPTGASWVIASTNPEAADLLQRWLQARGDAVACLRTHHDLPVSVQVDGPERVGIDRLLNAVAANHRVGLGRPKYIVDAGSAITADWVDAQGVFRGGAILPGFRLMAEALHRYTARLPLVAPAAQFPPLPARHTQAAIQAGMLAAVVGAITTLQKRYCETESPARYPNTQPMRSHLSPSDPKSPASSCDELACFLTGGDAPLLVEHLGNVFEHWPEMTLEGLRLSAQAKFDLERQVKSVSNDK